jgi:hypothetical protein
VVKVIKEMRDRKATGDDDVAGDVLNWWGKNSDATDQQRTRNWRIAQGFQ